MTRPPVRIRRPPVRIRRPLDAPVLSGRLPDASGLSASVPGTLHGREEGFRTLGGRKSFAQGGRGGGRRLGGADVSPAHLSPAPAQSSPAQSSPGGRVSHPRGSEILRPAGGARRSGGRRGMPDRPLAGRVVHTPVDDDPATPAGAGTLVGCSIPCRPGRPGRIRPGRPGRIRPGRPRSPSRTGRRHLGPPSGCRGDRCPGSA